MNLQTNRAELVALGEEACTLIVPISSAEFVSWRSRTESALTRALGADHHITSGFKGITWHGRTGGSSDWLAIGYRKASGYLEAAADEVAVLDAASKDEALSPAAVDPELWEHIASHVAAQAWGTVASQTAIFTEDRIRRWTGQPPGNVGEKLMTAALGENGDYRLGLTTGEKNGWHRFGMGISMALRNADAHRIQNRQDHRLYAMGVVGASSLLLTQLRYEHGNRFQDVGAVPHDATTSGTNE